MRRYGQAGGGASSQGWTWRASWGALVRAPANGLVDPSRILRKDGLRTGQALVLTKPLGTGVLFAAQMRLEAKAPWIDAAVASMLLSNRDAAGILARHGATGCTDVTGFGLAGHLLEMLRPAGRGARLCLADVPALPGALDCLGRGLASSLQDSNQRAVSAIANAAAFATHDRLPLLFDPQTSGGLLAGVPEAHAAGCVEALRAAGYAHATIIGQVTPPEMAETPIRLE